MSIPRRLHDAQVRRDALLQSIEHERPIIEIIEQSVLTAFEVKPQELYGVLGYKKQHDARACIALLLKRHPKIRISIDWLGSYLWTSIRDIQKYLQNAEESLAKSERTPFKEKILRACAHANIDPKQLANHRA